MTFNKTFQDENMIVFKKESQMFSNAMKFFAVLGVGVWVLGNILAGVNAITTLFLIGVIIYLLWVIFKDNAYDESKPNSHTFLLNAKIIKIEMNDGMIGYIPFSDIGRFEIEEEHRSPIYANSIGVNYIHYHVSVIRKNGGVWNITSSTQEEESREVLRIIEQNVTLPSQQLEIEHKLPDSIRVKGSYPLVVRWSDYQTFYINELSLVFENRKRKIKREFAMADFRRVAYSYSEANESDSVIVFYFQDQSSGAELPFKMNTELNPVECLQFENWLHQEISTRKKLIA